VPSAVNPKRTLPVSPLPAPPSSLQVLRALRPLRLISRYPKLRLVVNSILGAIPRVRNVAVINLLFMVIFAVVGVQVWRAPCCRAAR
jgi:hypothetical protein